jgi:membrane-bound ClpP family serine protease
MSVTLFLVIGGIGLALVVVSMVVGDLVEGVFGALDFGIPTPVIGAFLAAFGFGGALISTATSANGVIAAVGGLGSGVVVGGISLAFTKSLMNMPTDEPVRADDLVGKTATVITRIPEGGIGEVSLSVRGQLQKLGARSSAAVAAGNRVTVVSVTSPTSVVVEPIS